MTKWTAPDIASIRGDNSRPLQKIFGSLTEYLKDYQNTIETGSAQSSQTFVRNGEATTLTIGTVVYLDAQQGDRATVKRAFNTSDATSAKTLGVVAETIPANADGLVTTLGYLEKVNTSAFTAGQTLYLGSTAGTFTATKPVAPNHMVYVGVVVRANAGNGIIYVRCQNGYELDEIHDVLITSPTTGDILMRNGSSLWVNTPQTSITSVGTLTAGNVPASLLSGTALPASIVSSSLTSVGTLSALRVDGNFGIGASGLAQMGLRLGKNIGGSAFSQGIYINGTIQTDVTSRADMIWTTPSVAASATVPAVNHFYATLAGVGVGATVTSTAGFVAESNIGNNYSGVVTSAYSFMGNLNTLAGYTRYNLFMNGSAPNYLGGRLGVGVGLTSGAMAIIANTTAADKAFIVRGAASQSGDLFDIQSSAGTSMFKLDSGGDVGIGTASPNYKLHLVGGAGVVDNVELAIDVAGGNIGDYAGVLMRSAEINDLGSIRSYVEGSYLSNMRFYTAGATNVLTERMRIDSSGNVGIGTTTPSSYGLLSVGASIGASSTTNMIAMYQSAGVDSATMRIAGYAYAGAARTAIDFIQNGLTNFQSQMVFSTSAGAAATERMRIDSAGFVGIGTNAPTVRLEVAGSTTISSQNNVAATFGTTTSGRLLVGSITGNTPFIGAEGATNLLFYTNALERIRITSDGNVGVGTTSLTGISFRVNKNITGAINSYASIFQGTVQADVTSQAYGVYVSLGTTGTPATAPTLTLFSATQGTLAGTVTSGTQRAYFADSNLIGAANNYAFQGAIPSGPNTNYNLYMNGTAPNYLAGRLGVGATLTSGAMTQVVNTTAGDKVLVVKGAALQSGSLLEAQNSSGTALVTINSAGKVGIGNTAPENTLDITGSFGRGNPAVKTANFTLAGTENWIICNGAGTINITLPTPADCDGREFGIKTISPQLVNSASANVIAIGGGIAGTAILPATSGAWAILVSDGANWNIMCRGT